MKVCVTMTGVCRPTFERVRLNIENNIAYFTKTYPEHSFTFYILTYKNKFLSDLDSYCKANDIKVYFIDPIEEKDYIFPVKMSHPNVYRVFYSMKCILDQIPKDEYDCIVRLRIDGEVKVFEIHREILDGVYYSLDENNSGRCSDNIGYASCRTMRTIWEHKNCLTKGSGAECVLFNTLQKYGYVIRPFKFHFILYQSADEVCDGVPQWSKRSREWIYDGKKYMLNNI